VTSLSASNTKSVRPSTIQLHFRMTNRDIERESRDRAEFPRNLGIAADGTKCKVLVVDDERVITDTLAIILNQYGFDVSVAYEGLGAIECAQRVSPELVIMGVIMPNMNGVDAGIRIRQSLPDCRILLFSGSGHTHLLVEDARARGYEFEWVAKAVHPNAVLHWLSVKGVHDVRSCSWCKECRSMSKAYPHSRDYDTSECACTWCVGLRTSSSAQ
jgi:CheY-like chemotaxis protein